MDDIVSVIIDYTKEKDYYSPGDISIKKGDAVIVETENGISFGNVFSSVAKINKKNLNLPLKKIVRRATKKDIEKQKEIKKEAELALIFAKKEAKKLLLNMSFIDCTYRFDKKQLYFYFVADQRVDFRELARTLAQQYKTRIELRQIGVRDKAKKIGGLGPCGLFLCCTTFLNDFNTVSINMAKNQFLALNPSKINGVCGRLLCCLNYEDDTYNYLKKEMPMVGNIITLDNKVGKVISVDIFKRTYKVDFKEKGIVEYKVNEKIK